MAGPRTDLTTWRDQAPTTDDVGLTWPILTAGALMPSGYHRVRHRRLVGLGDAAYAACSSAVLGWRMHRAAGLRVSADGPAALGATVVLRLGPWPSPVLAPCRVVWSVDEPGLTGFGYATLPGHPERGEEGFLVRRGPDGQVWFEIAAFSRAALWWTRAAGPVGRSGQRFFARRCAAVLARIAAE